MFAKFDPCVQPLYMLAIVNVPWTCGPDHIKAQIVRHLLDVLDFSCGVRIDTGLLVWHHSGSVVPVDVELDE